MLAVGNYEYGIVSKIRASDMQVQGTYASGSGAGHLVFDGTNIWVSNTLANTLTKFRASIGYYLGSFPAPAYPQQLAFDGANVLVASWTSQTLAKF